VENARDRVRRQLRPVPLPRQRHVVEHRDGERRGFPGSPSSTRRSGRPRRRRWRRLHRDPDVERGNRGRSDGPVTTWFYALWRAVPRSVSVSWAWPCTLILLADVICMATHREQLNKDPAE
jgi:hypothetical protein